MAGVVAGPARRPRGRRVHPGDGRDAGRLPRAATAQKQKFDDFESFAKAGRDKQLKCAPEDWLPPALLDRALDDAEKGGAEWKLGLDAAKNAQLLAVLRDGTRITATVPARAAKGARAVLEVDDLAPTLDKARGLINDGKKAEARALLQDGLKKHPKSPAAADAKKALAEAK